MSIPQFSTLSSEEKELMFHAPALVACLIAGSEGKMNETEEEKSKHLVRIRTQSGDSILFDYFKVVDERFDADLKTLDSKYGNLQIEPRTQILVDELSKLNDILNKIDSLFARSFVKSLRAFAHAIAESSGGIFGFLSVSYEESQVLGLEMITYES